MAKSDTTELMATSSPKTMSEKAFYTGSSYLFDLGEVVAGYRVGQFLFRKTDDALKTLEKSVLWSVQPQINPPPAETESAADKKSNECLMTKGSKKKTSPVELVRPLPWVFFLPLLVVIRCLRKCDELRADFLKQESTPPKQMVRTIQGVRRRLRAIKFRGMRNMSNDAAKGKDAITFGIFSSLSIFKFTRGGEVSELGSEALSQKTKVKSSSAENREEEEEEEEEEGGGDGGDVHIRVVLDRQGNCLDQLLCSESDSESDPDFEPNSSLDSNSTDDSEESYEEPALANEMKRLSQPTSLIAADIIEEESEEAADQVPVVDDQDVSGVDADVGKTPKEEEIQLEKDLNDGSQNDEAGTKCAESCSISAKSVDVMSTTSSPGNEKSQ